jgi:hypothetical protein
MFDYLTSIFEAFLKHGWSLPLVGGVLIAVYKQRPSKRWLKKHFPRLVFDESDVMNYEVRQKRIEAKIDALAAYLGVEGWDAGRTQSSINTEKKRLTSSSVFGWVTRVFVIGAKQRTMEKHSGLKRCETKLYSGRLMSMKEYLRSLGRTKFIAFMIATCTNVGLIIGYALNVQDIQTQVTAWAPVFLAVSQLLAGVVYQWVEGSKDKAVAVGAAQIEVAKANAEGKPPESVPTAVSDIEKSYHGE